MSTTPPPPPPNPSPPTPARPEQPPRSRQFRARGCLLVLALLLLFVSLGVNFLFVLAYSAGALDSLEDDKVQERFYLGDRDADDKIAVVRVSGIISEAGIAHPIRQLRTAAADEDVKAIVLRVDSPGGTVTASEELYQCIVNARDDNDRRFPGSGPKPVSVSMGGLAASGGYYVAVAGSPVVAEKNTITGSIGVFAALPNVAEWADRHGVRLELVKAGGMKASGSFFHTLSPEERQTWQDTIDGAYDNFLDVIARGRPGLTPEALRTQVIIDRMVPKRDEKGNPVVEKGKPVEVKYTRVRADGGTFTAQQAVDAKLIDGIEDLPAAVRSAATRNGLTKYKAVVYDKPPTLFEVLTGMKVNNRQTLLEAPDLSANLTPRLWYLAPSADAGLLAPLP